MFLLVLCLQVFVQGEAELAAPHNVTVETLNTNYKLSWDWDQSAAEGHTVTFTTQFVINHRLEKKSPNWSTACNHMSHRSCDLTEFDLHYLVTYMLRVRANSNGRHSSWVQKEFYPDRDAAVGPPSRVALSPAGEVLNVFISDPVTSTNSSMKEKLPRLSYLMEYWEGFVDTQASEVQMLHSNTNLVTLPELKAWTWYCVRVQSCSSDFFSKSSSFTAPHCLQTEGAVQWWLIFLFFLGSLVIFFAAVLLALFFFFRIYKTVKMTFCPSSQLPAHLKQYLYDSPGSDITRLITPDIELEHLCDKVTLCPEPLLENHIPAPEALPAPPSGLEPDSRHSHQDSSGIGDSGVDSTEGNSGQRQLNSSSRSSSGAEASWQSPFDSEQLNMQDMFAGLKSPPVMADEGVVDMCV